jgi:hypothetical protein
MVITEPTIKTTFIKKISGCERVTEKKKLTVCVFCIYLKLFVTH